MTEDQEIRRRRLSQNLTSEKPSVKQQGRRGSVASAEMMPSDGSVFASMEFDTVEARELKLKDSPPLRWAAHTHPGRDPGRAMKTNQDSFAVCEQLSGDTAFFGVFDGHGFHGHKVSQQLAEHLPKGLKDSPQLENEMEELCRNTFGEVNGMVLGNSAIDCEMSGSTGIVALLKKGALTVLNVGDSRAIIGSVDEIDGKVKAESLNVEHKPNIPAEAERIVSSGGRIQPYMYRGEPVGPPRVWLKNEDVPGLCMTRAFGDRLASSVGVTADPEAKVFQLKPKHKYLVLCSDGITEFMTDDEIIQMVHAMKADKASPDVVAQKLLEESRERWIEEEEEVIDDCTLIVIFF